MSKNEIKILLDCPCQSLKKVIDLGGSVAENAYLSGLKWFNPTGTPRQKGKNSNSKNRRGLPRSEIPSTRVRRTPV
jgi:hypothetical protein